MSNILGVFTITLMGQERQLKASFEAIEAIERIAIKPILRLFKEGLEGEPSMTEMVTVFHCGLAARQDTRLSRSDIGNAILDEGGMSAFAETYIQFLAHCVTGNQKGKENPL